MTSSSSIYKHMEVVILVSSLIALILAIWFKTDAWIEYTRLLHLNFLSFYKDFDVKQAEDASLTYHIYLRKFHDCFFVRLITCPICLGIWLGLIVGAAIFGLLFILGFLSAIFLLGAVGSLLLIPVYIIGGIVIFGIIDKLIS